MRRSRDPLVLYGSAGRPRGEDMPAAVEAITEAELTAAMALMGYPSRNAPAIFNRALERRRGDINPQIDGNEAITVDELRASLKRLGYIPFEAAGVVTDILEHRKPEFEPGDIVTGHYGATFIRQADGTWKGTHGGSIYRHLEGPLTKIGVAV